MHILTPAIPGRRRRLPMALGLSAALIVSATPNPTQDVLPGPVPAEVVRVVDGDTLTVRAHVWLGQRVEVEVRLAGIDAPELRGRCPRESELARAAQRAIEGMVATAAVRLREVRHDKYGGRVLARVETADGRDLGAALVQRGLARRYDGGRREGWCPAVG